MVWYDCLYMFIIIKNGRKIFDGFTTKLFLSAELKDPPEPTDPDLPKHW